jgi:hypothetical protein
MNSPAHWVNRCYQLEKWLKTHDEKHPDYQQNLSDFRHAQIMVEKEAEPIVLPEKTGCLIYLQ